MPIPSRLKTVLRSVLALLLALAAIPAVNLAGAWVSDVVLGLPPGGPLRLAVDLAWVFLAGLVGTWLMVRTAATRKTAHAWVLFVLYLALDLQGAIAMWDDFPRWFTVGVVASLPLQVWLGWWLAWGRRHSRESRDTLHAT